MATLEEAIAAIKAGDVDTGRELLANVLQVDYDNEKAWLWLSSVVESKERRRQCLERVLEINPNNQAAKRGLAKLGQQPRTARSGSAQADQPAGPLLSRLAPKDPEAELQSSLAGLQQKRLSQPEESVENQPSTRQADVGDDAPPGSQTPEESETIEAPWLEEYEQAEEPALAPASESGFAQDSPEGELAETESWEQPDEPDPSEDWPETVEPERAEPSSLFDRLAAYWETEEGKVVLGGSLAGVVVICAACIVLGLVFQPLIAPTVSEATETPVPTLALVPVETPTATSTFPPTFTPSADATRTATASPTRVVADTATPTQIPTRGPTRNPNLETGQVVGVIEGDIIDVLIGQSERRVKYILVDAPAVDDPELGTEPLGPEALALNRQLVEGQMVTLERDEQNEDEVGRLLRYVYVGELMVNEELIRQGLARVELVPPNLKYAARLQEVERAAREQGTGIWSLAETSKPPEIAIVEVNDVDEYVVLQNLGDEPQDLAGWRLVSELNQEECELQGILGPGETLRVWALLADQNQAGFNCGFTQNIWSNAEPDPAVLYNSVGLEVARLD